MNREYGFNIAIQDIQENEEITEEHGFNDTYNKLKININSGLARESESSPEVDDYFRNWEEKVKPAILEILNVDPSLMRLLDMKRDG